MNRIRWENPRVVERLDECRFYHSMDIPGYGAVSGKWDLRGREEEYLGRIDPAGKRVLEVGTASGHLCFTMERHGADVVAYDLDDRLDWDIVPFGGAVDDTARAERSETLRRLNNGFWLAHRAFGSRARVARGTVYDFSPELGRFEVAVFGSVLLHVRDPFLALERAATLVSETLVVTDVLPGGSSDADLASSRLLAFAPDAARGGPSDTWWHLSPGVIGEFLRVLGFADTETSFHLQRHADGERRMFTVVGRRRVAGAPCDRVGSTATPASEPSDQELDRVRWRRLVGHLARRLQRRLGPARE